MKISKINLVAAVANRQDPVLFGKAKHQFVDWVNNFHDEQVFYRSSIGLLGREWTSLEQFLETGNPASENPITYIEFVAGQTSTFLGTTGNYIISKCEVDNYTISICKYGGTGEPKIWPIHKRD